MDQVETGLLRGNPWVTRRPITVDEYHRMGEAGILTEDDRVELIEGELVAMAPIGSDHSGTVNALNHLLVMAVHGRAVVAVQNPVILDDRSEPQPDFAVLRYRDDHYRRATPRAEDVVLIVEIANSSLNYDRAVKRPLYARRGIPEYWIVNVSGQEVEVCRTPVGDRYDTITRAVRGDVLEPALLPGVTISVDALLG